MDSKMKSYVEYKMSQSEKAKNDKLIITACVILFVVLTFMCSMLEFSVYVQQSIM